MLEEGGFAMRYVVLLCLLLVFGFPCQAEAEEAWRPRRASFSKGASSTLDNWINQHVPLESSPYSVTNCNIRLIKRLVRGTLIWAYSHGNNFNADMFLESFTNKDDSLTVAPMANGGLIFWLNNACLKISIHEIPTTARSDSTEAITPSGKWYAALFANGQDTMFYFSGVSPFHPPEARFELADRTIAP